MKHIFYMMAFMPLISSMYNVRHPRKSWKEFLDYKSRKKKGKEYLTPSERGYELSVVLILFWSFLGMFTFQGPVFFVLLLLTQFTHIGLKTRFVCAVLTVLLIVFAIFNSYYLKINVFELIGLYHG